MPSRSVLLLAGVAAALSLALPAAADATVVVVDRAGHLLATPVPMGRPDRLVGWTSDGARLVVLDRTHDDRALTVDPGTGARTVLGPRPGAVAVGPGDRWASSALTADQRHLDVVLHAPDGRAIASVRMKDVPPVEGLPQSEDVPRIGWSADGTRLLVSASEEADVLDTATGAILRRTPVDFASAHGLSPDGTTLLVTRQDAVWRIDVATGAAIRLTTDADAGLWSPTGRVALLDAGVSATLDAGDEEIFLPSGSREAAWTPDGTALTVIVHAEPVVGHCTSVHEGVLVLAPDADPRPLLKPRPGAITNMVWSPDGTRAAIDVAFDDVWGDPNRRGPRHPWPRHVRKDYAMFTARGDRAVHQAVVRFAADLRGGMGRRRALDRLGSALKRIARQPWGEEVSDTQVGEAIADQVDAWLHAAGFGKIDALDDLEGGAC
jgi:hypothetical protein